MDLFSKAVELHQNTTLISIDLCFGNVRRQVGLDVSVGRYWLLGGVEKLGGEDRPVIFTLYA